MVPFKSEFKVIDVELSFSAFGFAFFAVERQKRVAIHGFNITLLVGSYGTFRV